MSIKDMKGKRFSKLMVLDRAPSDREGNAAWRCRCDCGREIIALGRSLRRGLKKSCGCLGTGIGDRARRHGHCAGRRRTQIYDTWLNMLARCYNRKHESYPRYGGRGIRVCRRWRKFPDFFADMGNPPSRKHSIDRRNNDGDYTPRNCRWATRAEQAKNQEMTPRRLAGLRRNLVIARKCLPPLKHDKKTGRFLPLSA